MNIAEAGVRQPLDLADGRLGRVRCSGSDRGVPGRGDVRWDAMVRGPEASDDRGSPVPESFAGIDPDLLGATAMRRVPSYASRRIAEAGIAFLRVGAAEVGLA